MNINEKAAYLKGLMAGMKLDEDSDNGKLFKAVADLLGDIAASIKEIEDDQAYLNDYIEELDEDLGELEDEFYGDDCCCCGCYDCDCGEDCDCGCNDDCDCCDFDEIICPSCNEPIYLDEDSDADVITCPSCNADVEVDNDEE